MLKSLTLLLCFIAATQTSSAQEDNFERLLRLKQESKTFYLKKLKTKSSSNIEEKRGYYLRLVPPVYRYETDTLVLCPALNGNMDTSFYKIVEEVLVIREANLAWRRAKVSKECNPEVEEELAICYLKTPPKYKTVEYKKFSFNSILDTSNTDFIIPAQILLVQREVLEQEAKLERLYLDELPKNWTPDRFCIKIEAGQWSPWEEVVCTYGVFNQPSILEIQEALIKQGYSLELSNQYDQATKNALHRFQKDQQIPIGDLDELSIERLKIKRRLLIEILD